jgi:hypothetical protein
VGMDAARRLIDNNTVPRHLHSTVRDYASTTLAAHGRAPQCAVVMGQFAFNDNLMHLFRPHGFNALLEPLATPSLLPPHSDMMLWYPSPLLS